MSSSELNEKVETKTRARYASIGTETKPCHAMKSQTGMTSGCGTNNSTAHSTRYRSNADGTK